MRVWLDTEFNGFHGELLSIGMIAENGEYFYTWFDIGFKNLVPWVQDNVYPHFTKPLEGDDPFESSIPYVEKRRLQEYLRRVSKYFRNDIEIIADWPEDIHHLCEFMITGPGLMIDTPDKIMFTVDRTLNGYSQIPHHALYDALGNMEAQLSREQMIKQTQSAKIGLKR